jgi:hypothetical protein
MGSPVRIRNHRLAVVIGSWYAVAEVNGLL